MNSVWAPGWEDRLREAVRSVGHDSVLGFCAAFPAQTYTQLCDILGSQFAPIQLLALIYAEANETKSLEWAARDVLAREILDQFPDGWATGPNPSWTRIFVLSEWSTGIINSAERPDLEPVLDAVCGELSLEGQLPAAWKPSGPDDPVITRVFKRCWHDPSH